MEVGSCSSAEKMMWACSIMESVVVETVVAASKFLTCILLMIGPQLNDINGQISLELLFSAYSFIKVYLEIPNGEKMAEALHSKIGPQLNDINGLPIVTPIEKRFSLEELHKMKRPDSDLKDASETEDDDDEDDDNGGDDQDEDDDDDAGDEDFSGEEGEEEGDPEDDAVANGAGGGSDDDDEDDDDDDGDEDDGDEDDDEEEEEEEEDVPQPPAKKRK